jgi:peroxiredoxin
MMRKRTAHYRIFFELLILVGVVSASAILLARIWMRTIEPVRVPPEPVVDLTPYIQLAQATVVVPPSHSGQSAPDFTLPTLGGDSFTLSEFRGHPVVINFWTSWCAPCRAEMPELVRAYEAHHNSGLVVVGVNVTDQDRMENAQAFIDEFDVTYPIAFDETGSVSSELYGVLGLPTSVFVNSEGAIQRTVMGEVSGEALNRYIAEIIADTEP